MAKTILILAGVAAAVGSAYTLREQIAPYLPAGLASAAHDVSSTGTAQPAAHAERRDAAKVSQASGKGKRGGGGPAPVTTAVASLADMPVILSAPGTVEAMATVGIKPRVDGQIVEVGFKEGDLVEAGTVLYRLDGRLIHAQIRQAEAAIKRDQASLKDALAILERKEVLLQKRYASEAATETARQQVEVLKAAIAAGQASLEMQKTLLDYLTIRAPISGRTGSMNAKLGAFVRSADPTPIVTINQTKPIAVAFALPQINLTALKRALAEGADAKISVRGDMPFSVNGKLIFVDNQVDKTTGTVTAKLEVANETEALWPGLAVLVDLTVEVRPNLIAVPASAVLPAQQGMIAWVVDAANKVSVRVVKQERVVDQTAFVTAGLKAGERVVTDGQLRLSPGASVVLRDEGPGKRSPTNRGKSGEKAPAAASPGEAVDKAGSSDSGADGAIARDARRGSGRT
jgi:multidrug efflux system membrane fusion protein